MKDLNRETLGKVRVASHDVAGKTVITGMFRDYAQAKAAITALRAKGFQDNQIGVIVRDRDMQGKLVEETNIHNDHLGAATGAVGGTVLGGLAGLLLGTGSLLIPGIGPVVAGGFFIEALGATALGAGIGAAGGSLLGALVDMGMSDEDATYFENGFRTGNILVTVQAGNMSEEALEILMRNGADVGNSLQARDIYAHDARRDTTLATDRVSDMDRIDRADYKTPISSDLTDQNLELKKEELLVNKQQVQAGEVVVNKRVVEEQKNIDVPVTHEEIIIERHQVNERMPSDAHFGQQEETVRIPVMEEKLNVDKQTLVSEELNIGKKQVTDTEHVSETLRREEADIQNRGNVDIHFNENRRDI